MEQIRNPGDESRLVSLDAFRGITIAGMLLVNNPGSWEFVYRPLRHADWHGWTPTDLVFPFFLFIVGVAMTLSFARRLKGPGGRGRLLAQAVRRSLILFLLGLMMAALPDYTLLHEVRAGRAQPPLIVACLSIFRLAGPYVLAVIGLSLLRVDASRLQSGTPRAALLRGVVAVALLAAAVAYFALDFGYFQERKLRVPGVLQRIAACYFLASLILLSGGVWIRAWAAALILIVYYAIVTHVPAPGQFVANVKGDEGRLHEWIDVHVLGNHLYSERPDPEGILSTLPATATVLAGVLSGHWLLARRDKSEKTVGLYLAGSAVLVLGLWLSYVFPINKKIWTSSYVLVTAGAALFFLAPCYWLIDVKGRRKWAWPFVVYGSNAIVVYVAASTAAKTLAVTKLADGQTSVKSWVYQHLLASWAGPWAGSLAYPILYNLLWLVPMIWLYRRRIFIKV